MGRRRKISDVTKFRSPFNLRITTGDSNALPCDLTIACESSELTWNELFCAKGIVLNRNVDVFVHTWRVNGWTAELDEPISTFLAKYKSRNRSVVAVRLVRDTCGSRSRRETAFEAEKLQGDRNAEKLGVRKIGNGMKQSKPKAAPGKRMLARRPIIGTGPSGSIIFGPTNLHVKRPYTRRSTLRSSPGRRTRYQPTRRAVASSGNDTTMSVNHVDGVNNGIDQNQETETEDMKVFAHPYSEPPLPCIVDVRSLEPNFGDSSNSVNAVSADDDEGDNISLCTGVTAENAELRREGIEIEDVKSKVMRNLSRFSNPMLLRIREEIKNLRNNHAAWDRHNKRSPYASYFLGEVFKLEVNV